MEKAKLKDISLDETDAALFHFDGDLLLKAKAIKYSILPKLNVLLEETLSRIRKIYGVEVFSKNSIIHSAPNFREKRDSDLKIDYDYAFLGLGGSRLPIWNGIKRIDMKPTKIIPFIIGYEFSSDGLAFIFDPLRYRLKFTKESNEIFLDFLLENLEYIQTIQILSGVSPIVYCEFENKSMVRPFREIIEDHKREGLCDIRFIRRIKSPVNYHDLESLISSFVIFFPIYFSLLEIAQNKKSSFKNIISELNAEQFVADDSEDEGNDKLSERESVPYINFDETKFIKAGVRWQVFERDDFKCVACGKTAHDGAILHIDHIIPRSKGGKNIMKNYQTLCHLCNIGKSNKSDKDLRLKGS